MIRRILIFISLVVFFILEGSCEDNMDLYYTPGSAPCRAVLLTGKLLRINFNLNLINLHTGEHKKPDFLKINPQHTIPTLVDDGFVVSESHAIVIYLVETYAKNDALYPKNIKQHTLVLLRLLFDATVLYRRFADAYYPLMKAGIKYTENQIDDIHEAFEFLNMFLADTEYVAGNQLTVADLSILASVTTIQAVDFDISKYRKVIEWLEKTKAAFSPDDYEEANGKGVEAFRQFYLQSKEKHRIGGQPGPSR